MSGLQRIQETFQTLRQQRAMAFMPFVTGGDPDCSATVSVIRALAAHQVDLIEVGFPYSDPIADGPTIQASYTRALEKGIQVSQILDAVASVKDDDSIPPLLAMVSYGIVFRKGPESFVAAARDAGFSGLIIPDLPGDEAGEFFEIATAAGLALIQLVAPTTPPERAARIIKSCSGFVYCVSVAGTTGVRDELPAELNNQLAWLRSQTDLPLAVGFGISRPEQIESLRGRAEGAIVGSAIVKQLPQLAADDAHLAALGSFAGQFAAVAHQSSD